MHNMETIMKVRQLCPNWVEEHFKITAKPFKEILSFLFCIWSLGEGGHNIAHCTHEDNKVLVWKRPAYPEENEKLSERHASFAL